MNVIAVKTSVFSPGMNLLNFILKHTRSQLKEKSILAITSKIISVAESRLVSKKNHHKKKLIQRECQYDLGSDNSYGCHLTIKNHLMLPSAGIDESNSPTGDYILYPKDPFSSLKKLSMQIRKKLKLQQFGLIMTDSTTTPLRKGVTGVAVSHYGFCAISSLIGSKDLFGRTLRMTTVNQADALAASAVLLMGEGDQSSPLALITSAPVVFTQKTNPLELKIPVEQDLYFSLYREKLSKN